MHKHAKLLKTLACYSYTIESKLVGGSMGCRTTGEQASELGSAASHSTPPGDREHAAEMIYSDSKQELDLGDQCTTQGLI